jgi:hypothetical protein
MSMPNDKEHQEIINYYNGPSTDKIKAIAKQVISEAEERITKNYLPFAQKVDEHEGFISKIKRNFLGIVKG